MKILITSILFVFMISACASNKNPYYNSSLSIKNSQINLNPIAKDLIELLSSNFNPTQTTLYLNTKDFNKDFFKKIEMALRKKGFALTNQNLKENTNLNAKKIIYVSYTISSDSDIYIASFSVNESKVNYMYKFEDDKLVSFGSVTSFDFKKAKNE